MKDDYDVLGPEATIQTTINNGTGESRVRSNVMFVLCHDSLDPSFAPPLLTSS